MRRNIGERGDTVVAERRVHDESGETELEGIAAMLRPGQRQSPEHREAVRQRIMDQFSELHSRG